MVRQASLFFLDVGQCGLHGGETCLDDANGAGEVEGELLCHVDIEGVRDGHVDRGGDGVQANGDSEELSAHTEGEALYDFEGGDDVAQARKVASSEFGLDGFWFHATLEQGSEKRHGSCDVQEERSLGLGAGDGT
jgi:hypothetical protein